MREEEPIVTGDEPLWFWDGYFLREWPSKKRAEPTPPEDSSDSN